MYLIEAGLICLRYNHIKTINKIAQNGSQSVLCYALGCLMPCFGISCPALVSSGILLVSSGCALVCLMVCYGYALVCLIVILWVCSGMSHGVLCPDDVLCKNRPCPNITLWILSIHVNLELIYEFIYTCQ